MCLNRKTFGDSCSSDCFGRVDEEEERALARFISGLKRPCCSSVKPLSVILIQTSLNLTKGLHLYSIRV